jgi:predicted nucleic acid-binding protein
MTSSADRWACDTSVAIAALDVTHAAHADSRRVVIARRPALAGHAAFEAYAVLTRLPVPLRLTGAQASEVLRTAFPDGCWLDVPAMRALLRRLPDHGIAGGSVYDALVGEAARTDGRTLLTRDRRAERTYRSLGVPYELVD